METKKGILNKGKTDPKVQEEADVFVANGVQIIHQPNVSDNLIKQIQSSKDPIEGIANATLSIVERLEESSGQNGVQISDTAKIHGANQLMGEIIQIAEIAGVPKLNDDQKYQAFSMAVSRYLDKSVKSGKMSKEQLAQMGKEAGATPEGQKITQQMSQPQVSMNQPEPGAMPTNQPIMGGQ